MVWKRAMLLSILVILGLSLQTAVFGRVTILGTRPELLLVVVVALAMGEGAELGAVSGFMFGLMQDVVSSSPAGMYALTFTVVGFSVGAIRAQMQTPSAWAPMGMVLFATFLGVLFYGAFRWAIGDTISLLRVVRHAGLASLYNALLTPFIFPLVRALAARLRPAGVSL